MSQSCSSCSLCKVEGEHVFRIFRTKKKEQKTIVQTTDTVIVFLLEGKMDVSYNGYSNESLCPGDMLLIPPASSVVCTVVEDLVLIALRIQIKNQLCENLSLLHLSTSLDPDSDNPVLTSNKQLTEFGYYAVGLFESGVKCSQLYGFIAKELFVLLRLFYNDKELSSFFKPILNQDILFKDAVLKNYCKAHTATELAKMMNYSLQGFYKKFKSCFGMPVYEWMQEQKASLVLSELKDGVKPIKEIGLSHGFSTQARFYEFCKKYFGKTPKEIRLDGKSIMKKI